jgi:hypothetical protein
VDLLSASSAGTKSRFPSGITKSKTGMTKNKATTTAKAGLVAQSDECVDEAKEYEGGG